MTAGDAANGTRSLIMADPPDDRATFLTRDASDLARSAGSAAAARSKAVVILNTAAGGGIRLGEAETTARIVAAFAANGIVAEVMPLPGHAIARTVRQRIGSASAPRIPAPTVIVAAGGDGTVRTVAQVLADSGIPLGILPLGTLNHFARDLGLPLDIAGAVAVIAAGRSAPVDAAEVNGCVFVNNSSIGFYPNMVRDRDRQLRLSRRAKWLAMALALLRALRRPIARRLTIERGGRKQRHRTPFAFVGNNVYDTTLPMLGRRATLSAGELCLFIAKPRGLLGIVGLMVRTALGRLGRSDDFERWIAKALTIHSRRRRMTMALDGEILRLRTPLRYRTRPAALRVLVPESNRR
jgi:diacylglycerol kinase family enzyme